MTGGVTRDSKSAEKRKYKARGELGSSPDRTYKHYLRLKRSKRLFFASKELCVIEN